MTLLKLAWPVVVSRSAQVVVGITDALMVAQLGESSLAAVTTGGMNALMVFILPMGTVFIVSSFSSQFFGRGDIRAARRFGLYGLMIAALTGVLIGGVQPFVGSILGLLGYEADVALLMTGYLSIRLFSGVFVVGLEALGNFYQGIGNTRLPMASQLIAMTANVVLNYALIFGNFGAPALGVKGAAIGSVCATGLGFFFILFCFWRRIGVPKPEAATQVASEGDNKSASSTQPLSRDEFIKVVRFGFPSGLNWFMEFAAFNFFINVVVAGLGTTSLAAMNTVIEISSMAFMPTFGIATAGSILVGQAIGKGRLDHASTSVRLTLMFACGWQVLAGALYITIPDILMSLFSTDTAAGVELVTIGASMLRFSVLWQFSDAVATTFTETLRAAGDTTWPLYARLSIAWFVFVPMSLIAVTWYNGGPTAAILSIVVYISLLAVAVSWRYRSGKWKSIGLTDDAPAAH